MENMINDTHTNNKPDFFVPVDMWHPSPEDSIITVKESTIMNIPFDKIFNNPELKEASKFLINKDSYSKQLHTVVHYINYFIKYYDTKNELLLSYFKMRSLMEETSNMDALIQSTYSIIFTDNIVNGIVRMVEDNFFISLEVDDGRKFRESLEFTTDHAKIMMQISIAIKILIPVVFHILNLHNSHKNKKLIYEFYEPLFDIFGGDINIYNKLYNQVVFRVLPNVKQNETIWNQRLIDGVNDIAVIHELLKDHIIVETLFRYVFNKNMVSMNFVILSKQLMYFLRKKYKEDRIEITPYRDSNTGLSGMDKFEMSLAKKNDGFVALAKEFIRMTIKNIKDETKMTVKKKELDYYLENFDKEKFHETLAMYFYAKYFNGYADVSMISEKDMMKLIILLKKRLIVMGYKYLPHLLTANIDGKLNNRTIQNRDFLKSLMTNPSYLQLQNKYYNLDLKDKSNPILNIISVAINSEFSIVDYENQDMYGELIEIDRLQIRCEMLDYLNMI